MDSSLSGTGLLASSLHELWQESTEHSNPQRPLWRDSMEWAVGDCKEKELSFWELTYVEHKLDFERFPPPTLALHCAPSHIVQEGSLNYWRGFSRVGGMRNFLYASFLNILGSSQYIYVCLSMLKGHLWYSRFNNKRSNSWWAWQNVHTSLQSLCQTI